MKSRLIPAARYQPGQAYDSAEVDRGCDAAMQTILRNQKQRQTLNRRIQDSGFQFYRCISNERFPEEITPFSIDVSRGLFKDYRIVDGETALDGSDWRLKEKHHLVYVKLSRKHPNYGKQWVALASPTLVHRVTGQENHNCPVHCL